MKPKFYYSIFAGEPKYERPEQRVAFLKGISKKPNIRYVETHEKYVQNRTIQQNKYYFGVVVKMIVKETGSDKETVHAELKKKFLLIKDGVMPVVGSTKDLSTIDFMKYSDECVLWAAEFLQIIIPPPPYGDERTQDE